MHAGEAQIEQISMTVLGHQSIDVTKRYLGTDLGLRDAATDRIRLRLEYGAVQQKPVYAWSAAGYQSVTSHFGYCFGPKIFLQPSDEKRPDRSGAFALARI